jgi:hypothetical protein
MPAGKMYIANTPELITAVQRNSKTLQFAPFASKSHRRLLGTSQEAEKIVLNNVDLAEGEWGLWHEALASVHAVLAPGEGLDQMNRVMIRNVTASLENLRTESDNTSISLMQWLRHQPTLATTEAVYGTENPFRDATIEESFW